MEAIMYVPQSMVDAGSRELSGTKERTKAGFLEGFLEEVTLELSLIR